MYGVVYCKLPTNGKQLPAFPLTAMTGIDPRPQRWEARVLPLCHRGPLYIFVIDIVLAIDLSVTVSVKRLTPMQEHCLSENSMENAEFGCHQKEGLLRKFHKVLSI